MLAQFKQVVKSFATDESGVTAIEYGILAAGVAVVIGVVASSDGVFATTLSTLFDSILEQMPEGTGGG